MAINIRGANPYDYADAGGLKSLTCPNLACLMEHLDTQLDEVNKGASKLLVDNGIDLVDAVGR